MSEQRLKSSFPLLLRSIEDELERETSGDVLTIALSYLIMFFYITFSLGQVNSVSSFMVRTS